MAEIVAVDDLKPEPRSIDDIVPTRPATTATAAGPAPAGTPARRTGPVVTGMWLHANVTDDIPTVIAAMFDEAERRDPHHQRTWVALVDGNNQQIDTITAQAHARSVDGTIVIDFVHAGRSACGHVVEVRGLEGHRARRPGSSTATCS